MSASRVSSLSLFTNIMYYLSKNAIMSVLLRHVSELYLLLWFLQVIWLNTPREDGTGLLEHVEVAIL